MPKTKALYTVHVIVVGHTVPIKENDLLHEDVDKIATACSVLVGGPFESLNNAIAHSDSAVRAAFEKVVADSKENDE